MATTTATLGLRKPATTDTVNVTTDISDNMDLIDAAVAARVAKSLFDANTILAATTDDTPVALAVGASTVVGRRAAGGIVAISYANLLSDLGAAPLASPAFTGTPTAPTQVAGNNSTRLATTAYADALVADAINDAVTGIAPSQNAVFDALALKAALASPTFTGTPTAPTQAASDNSTKLATTAYVDTGLALKANLASPTFTGTPAAPTAAQGTNTTQLATTAMVQSEVTLLAPKASPTFTGAVLIGDGTVGAPAIAFSSDADGTGTGFYRSAANTIAVATNGVQRLTIDSGGIIMGSGGNILLPNNNALRVTRTDATSFSALLLNGSNVLTLQTGSDPINISAPAGITITGDATTGIQVATAASQKLAFYGATRIVQPSGASQAAAAATGSTNVTPFGYTTAAQADAVVTLVNALRTALVNLGLIKGAA